MLQTDLMVFTPTMHAAEALKIPGDTRPTLLDTHKIAEHTKIGQMAIAMNPSHELTKDVNVPLTAANMRATRRRIPNRLRTTIKSKLCTHTHTRIS